MNPKQDKNLLFGCFHMIPDEKKLLLEEELKKNTCIYICIYMYVYIAAFFGKLGYIASVPLEDFRTVIPNMRICLSEIVHEIRKKIQKFCLISH